MLLYNTNEHLLTIPGWPAAVVLLAYRGSSSKIGTGSACAVAPVSLLVLLVSLVSAVAVASLHVEIGPCNRQVLLVF